MKTALITGASSGVAQALASKLRGQGWTLLKACRDISRLEAGAPAIEADVSTEAGAVLAMEAAEQAFGAPPMAVVNCAGSTWVAPITRTSEEHYRELLAANLDTAFFVGKAYALALQAAKQGGALVFFSTLAARVGIPNHAAIAAAKGAVEALTRAMAADHAATGLRVNCIAPGLMRTPMTEKMVANESAAKQIAAQYPLGRFGTAADAAALAAFLISDAATWITGQVIALDGGFSSVRPYVRNPSA